MITLTYDSTHYYLIDVPGGRLLVDAGMAGTLPKFQGQLKQYRVAPAEIKYIFFTHTHPDHAGIVQEIKALSGAKLIIHEKQLPYLEDLRAFYAKKSGGGGYVPIQVAKSDIVVRTPNQAALHALGIPGELVETPGHSDDSVSLVIDSHQAFTGDLTPYPAMEPEKDALLTASWKALIDRGVTTFYPAHADPFPVERIRQIFAL